MAELPVRFEVLDPPGPEVPEAPTDDAFYRGLTDAVRAHAPRAHVAPWTVVGANDSRFFAPRGVKTYGYVPVFLSKDQIDSIHGHDENVTKSEFALGLRIYMDALARTVLGH
jgi:acetylornithine deacetylase/succinyl-diaminopimelate desuccinylase-like protein